MPKIPVVKIRDKKLFRIYHTLYNEKNKNIVNQALYVLNKDWPNFTNIVGKVTHVKVICLCSQERKVDKTISTGRPAQQFWNVGVYFYSFRFDTILLVSFVIVNTYLYNSVVLL